MANSQFTVRLPLHLRKALDAAARREQRRPSDIVRIALQAYLGACRQARRPSDGARELIGSLTSGIPDLAERHREYLLESVRRGRG